MTMFGIQIGRMGVGVGRKSVYSPSKLFASGEQGAWYDPSDLTTMFQDSAGTTPVTADGQPVGLILDKSKGLVLGSELITNGEFSTGASWTLSNATISGGTLNCASATSVFMATQSISIVAEKTYKITFNVSGYVSGVIIPMFGVGGAAYGESVSSNGSKTQYIKAVIGNAEFRFLCTGAGFTGSVDNISVKELHGNHAVAPSDAARPLKTSTGLSKWINYDAVDDVLNSTFQSSLGSSCTVARANVGSSPTILTSQTIGTSYADSTDHAGLIIINRALTTQETTDLTTWLTAKGATS